MVEGTFNPYRRNGEFWTGLNAFALGHHLFAFSGFWWWILLVFLVLDSNQWFPLRELHEEGLPPPLPHPHKGPYEVMVFPLL